MENPTPSMADQQRSAPSPSSAAPNWPVETGGSSKKLLAVDDGVDDVPLYHAAHAEDDAERKLKKTRKRRRKDESLTATLCAWTVNHQIGISINLMLLLALAHICFPRARRRTRKYFDLSYRDPDTGLYSQGWDDMYFVAFWVVAFTGLRATIMDYVLMPCARLGGVAGKKERLRFAEQAWLLIYYSCFWSLGMYIMYYSKYWLNLREMWTDFPTRSIDGLRKWYYLVQFAFWLQQILVVNIEERRKDYSQMFIHHIITCTLMFTSYGYYQTKVGNVILCIMDFVDILLPAAKLLKYLKFQRACDVAFGVFIVAWFVTRHIIYPLVCWSVYADLPPTVPYGCYDSGTGARFSPPNASSSSPSSSFFANDHSQHQHPHHAHQSHDDTISSFAAGTGAGAGAGAIDDYQNLLATGGTAVLRHMLQPFRDPTGPVCFNVRIQTAFLALLLALQGITLVWFGMIIRVAWTVLKGQGADDSRSDVEDKEDEELELELEEDAVGQGLEGAAAVIREEEVVGAEALDWNGRAERARARARGAGKGRGKGRASGRRAGSGSGSGSGTGVGVQAVASASGSARGYKRAGAASRASGISIPGHGDRKELLGRIGCDKPS
ncbi:TLC domain-containing protein [Lineolata rhizophorae]|uniref:TLC domain-containing protein n=1 Tax=Lineolata rhizophorae TaxID=578093 RepID=A0A6A6NQW2_9PEZI|nr:TLC domain-containing protein [Lineolata rhizophorae]